jgi:hypothetical protein
VRHLATLERYMYAETVSGRPSAYPGCGRELAEGYEAVIAYFELGAESRVIFVAPPDVTPFGNAGLRPGRRSRPGSGCAPWCSTKCTIVGSVSHAGNVGRDHAAPVRADAGRSPGAGGLTREPLELVSLSPVIDATALPETHDRLAETP